jgi:hypothetical protein
MRRQSKCQKRRLTADNQLSQRGMAELWQTPQCAKKVGVFAILPVSCMILASIRRQKPCGVVSRADNVRATFREMKKNRLSFLAVEVRNDSSEKNNPPARVVFFFQRITSQALRYFSSVSLVLTSAGGAFSAGAGAAVGATLLGRPFLGAGELLASVTNSIMHMGDASPRRNPTLTMRV